MASYILAGYQLRDKKISRRNDMMYAGVLGGRLAGIGESSLRLYHACINLPPPPTGPSLQRIQQDLIIASEYSKQ